jgi:Zn-dependent protease with chaperone function
MHAGTWADLLAQSIVHGFVVAVAVEALIRLWRVGSPGERLALRLLAVVEPLVLSPVLVLACPLRADEEFRTRFALFTARHWEDVRLLGMPLFHVWLAAAIAAGLALLLMDVRSLLPRRRRVAAPDRPPPASLVRAVAGVAAAMGVRPPRLRFVEHDQPLLFCSGARRPGVVVSRGTLALLDPEELEAALAHEIAHVRRRDPAVSWALMTARALLFFNPAAQVVARAMARDAETRADDLAGSVRDRVALASALLKLYRATHREAAAAVRRTLPLAGALAEPFRRARTLDVERRCRRLLGPEEAPRSSRAAPRVALAAAALAALLVVVA